VDPEEILDMLFLVQEFVHPTKLQKTVLLHKAFQLTVISDVANALETGDNERRLQGDLSIEMIT
jgi:hypothetical protein